MYKTVMDILDDWNPFIENYGMRVKHFRLYRKAADRSREILLVFNHHYAGFAGDEQTVDPRYYLHIIVFEKGENRMLAGDSPLEWWTEYRLDIRPFVVDDFTLSIDANGNILVSGVCSGCVYTIPESPSLGSVDKYSPALLNEGRGLAPQWFGL